MTVNAVKKPDSIYTNNISDIPVVVIDNNALNQSIKTIKSCPVLYSTS